VALAPVVNMFGFSSLTSTMSRLEPRTPWPALEVLQDLEPRTGGRSSCGPLTGTKRASCLVNTSRGLIPGYWEAELSSPL